MAAKHPAVLLVDLQPPRAEVRAGLVARGFRRANDGPSRCLHGALIGGERPNHVDGHRVAGLLLDGAEPRELCVAARGVCVEGANPLRNLIDGEGQLVCTAFRTSYAAS